MLRDFRGDAELAEATKDLDAKREAVSEWMSKTRRFLKRGHEDGEQLEKCRPKKQRRKAHEWLLAIDNQLLQTTGRGLEKFKVGGDIADQPFAWPRLTIATDQGSDAMAGWC